MMTDDELKRNADFLDIALEEIEDDVAEEFVRDVQQSLIAAVDE